RRRRLGRGGSWRTDPHDVLKLVVLVVYRIRGWAVRVGAERHVLTIERAVRGALDRDRPGCVERHAAGESPGFAAVQLAIVVRVSTGLERRAGGAGGAR